MAEVSLGSKPPCHADDALAVVQRLREAGHTAYFAGGCVRDLLLGTQPKDYDVATDAIPSTVRSLFKNTQAVGQAFGVIIVRIGRSVVEVATFRGDGAYRDGRRPDSVRFTNAQEDAQRRDFTVNGLFLDPIDNRIIDYVQGQRDLQLRVIRAIGDPAARFAEDHLRLLRAVRFAARLEFDIDSQTSSAIGSLAQQLMRISPERIGEELRLMLTPITRRRALTLLRDLNLLDIIFRFMPGERAIADVRRAARRTFDHLAVTAPVPIGLALASAALDESAARLRTESDLTPLLEKKHVQQMVGAMRKALKISNDESNQMRDALEGMGILLTHEPPSVAGLKRFLARPAAGLSRLLLAAAGEAALIDVQRVAALEGRLAQLERTEFAPVPYVNGDDLTAMGLPPGPLFKRVLNAVYDAQLEDRVTSKEAALRAAQQILDHEKSGLDDSPSTR